MKSQRFISSADYIRAVASLMVAIFHLGGKALPVLQYGWLGVELFFVLSGFIICWALPENYTLRDLGTFLWKRVIRIEPPYLFSIILVLTLNILLSSNYKIDVKNLLLHIGYLNNFWDEPYLNPVYWTLGIEFQYYLFIAFFFPLLRKSYGVYLLVVATIGFTFLPHYNSTLLPSVFPLFSMGILCYYYLKGQLSKVLFIILLSIVTLFAITSMGVLKACVGLSAALILLFNLPANTVISFFSRISFSLYLTHDVIGSKFVVYAGTLAPKTIYWKGTIFLVGIAVSIGAAYLFYLMCEKPFLNLSKSYVYNKQRRE